MAHGVKNSKHIFPRSLATLSRMNFNSSLVFLANHEGAQLEILGLLKETHLKRTYNYLLFNYILDHPMRYVFPASCTLNHLESFMIFMAPANRSMSKNLSFTNQTNHQVNSLPFNENHPVALLVCGSSPYDSTPSSFFAHGSPAPLATKQRWNLFLHQLQMIVRF